MSTDLHFTVDPGYSSVFQELPCARPAKGNRAYIINAHTTVLTGPSSNPVGNLVQLIIHGGMTTVHTYILVFVMVLVLRGYYLLTFTKTTPSTTDPSSSAVFSGCDKRGHYPFLRFLTREESHCHMMFSFFKDFKINPRHSM